MKIFKILCLCLIIINFKSNAKEIWGFNYEVPGAVLSDIDSYDSEHIFFTVFTPLSRCYMTTDGGENWENIIPYQFVVKDTNNLYDGYPFFSVCAHGKDLLLIGSTEGKIYKTADLGKHWEIIDTKEKANIIHIKMYDNQNGVMVVEYSNFYQELKRTTDGGYSWSKIKSPSAFGHKYVRNLKVFDANEYIASFQNLKLQNLTFKTTNGGNTWFVPDSNIHTTSFFNNNEGIGLSFSKTSTGTLYNQFHYTSDKGNTWQKKQMTDTLEKIMGVISFVNKNRGVYYSTTSKLIYQTDSEIINRKKDSIEFYHQYSYFFNPKKIHFVSENKAFLLNSYDRIFSYTFQNSSTYDDKNQIKNTTIYPNPAKSGELVNLNLPELMTGEILIHDIFGKQIEKFNFFANSFRLREDISPGTYFLIIKVNDEILAREKFVVVE